MSDEASRALHSASVVVDPHNDLLGMVVRRPLQEQGTYFRSAWLPQLQAGGVDVQVLPTYTGNDDLREIILMLDCAHRLAEANDDVVGICLNGDEIDEALAAGKIALVLALEGCGAFGTNLGLVEATFRLGVRIASLTHVGRTAFADGSGEDAAGSRLTRAGVEAVALMEELGIVVDVSHLSASGVDDILERTRRPVVATHSSAFALCEHHRNLTDERLRRIGALGGVIGVNFIGPFLDPDAPTIERAVDHILHIGAAAGMDHVGLGPDFIADYAAEIIPRLLEQVTPRLAGPSDLPRITEALLRRGVAEDSVRAILGENWLRVLRSEMGVRLNERRVPVVLR